MAPFLSRILSPAFALGVLFLVFSIDPSPALAQCPVDGALPTQPARGATVTATNVTFSWEALPNAQSYALRASHDLGPMQTLASASSNTATVPLAPGRWDWYVDASFANGCRNVRGRSSVFVIPGGGSCSRVPPIETAPAYGAKDVPPLVTFQWTPVTGAGLYDVHVSIDEAPWQTVARTTETSATTTVPAGWVRWYVAALVEGCGAINSQGSDFFTTEGDGSCRNLPPTPLRPAEGTEPPNVEFKWTTTRNATSYAVWVSVNGGGKYIAGQTASTSLRAELPAGNVEWSVEAIFPNCQSLFSIPLRFTVSPALSCPSTPPTITSPAQGASLTNPVTFSWSALPNAIAYSVFTSNGSEAAALLARTPLTSVTRYVPPGDVTWYLEAEYAGCPPVRSAANRFSVPVGADCTGDAPQLLTPAPGGVVPVLAEFSWTAVARASEYRVWLSDGGPARIIASVSEPRHHEVLPVGSYSWWVEALFPDCRPSQSAPRSFSVPQSSSCPSTKPPLLAPATGAALTTNTVDFSWGAASGASLYQLWLVQPDGTQNPMHYASAPGTYTGQLRDGEYDWFVRAYFGASCPPIDSDRARFRIDLPGCDSRRAMLVSPPDGASDVPTNVELQWTAVPKAKGYNVLASFGSGAMTSIGTTPGTPSLSVNLPDGAVEWSVVPIFDGCPGNASATSRFTVGATTSGCTPPPAPLLQAVAQTASGDAYALRWGPVANGGRYELQESTSEAFTASESIVTSGFGVERVHETTAPTAFYYRVRALSRCSEDRGPFSPTVRVVVVPATTTSLTSLTQSTSAGSEKALTHRLTLPGSLAGTVNIASDRPWLSAPPAIQVPASGTWVPITIDPSLLQPGSNPATLTLSGSAGKQGLSTSGSTTVPVSVSVVTPVVPSTVNAPPPNTMIIPAVAHAGGFNSQWQSDVRIANTSAQIIKYRITFVPSETDATKSARSTTIALGPRETMALDDILKSWFGYGTSGESAVGVIEIRPLNYTDPSPQKNGFATIATSRTYNLTPNGTFGQFIPAIPVGQFAGKGTAGNAPVLSLQQLSESANYRTNVGLVEALGQPATVLMRVFDGAGVKRGEFTESLKPGEHRQMNGWLAKKGIALADGRIEARVTSDTGAVTVYASVVDNRTNDPLLVSAIDQTSIGATRYVIPGIADFNTGVALWRSDVRIYNAGASAQPATVTFYRMNDPASTKSTAVTLQPGEVLAYDNVLPTLFGESMTGGVIHVTTPSPSRLIASARTYDDQPAGTFGQFIPAVTELESTGAGGRALQLLQVEESARFRSNLGITEMTGNAATVEIAAVVPNSTVVPKMTIQLRPFEFTQITSVLKAMNLPVTYNARLSLRVTGGTGRISAYLSMIDNQTKDPTYVPAQ